MNTSYSALDMALYPDSLWSRYFEQTYPMGQFNHSEDLANMMLFYADYYNYTLSGNDTTNKLFITGLLNEVITVFQNKASGITPRLKWYFYSDHDDSIVNLATAFGYRLPTYAPFASQIVFELYRNTTMKKPRHFIRLKINDVPIILKGSCGG